MSVKENKVPGLRMVAIAAAMACMASLAACGGSGSDSPATPPVTPPPVVPEQAPAITSQPSAPALAVGASATLSVSASGTGALAYQWSRNGVAIDGATGASYTLAAVRPDDNGAILRVTVRNAVGSVDSAPVQLALTGAGARTWVGAVGEKTGAAATPTFQFPLSVAVDASGNLIVPDGEKLFRVSATGVVTAVTPAQGCVTRGAATDKAGNLYTLCGHAVYKVAPSGAVTIVAGRPGQWGYAEGTGADALFNSPDGLAVDADGVIYVSDYGNRRLRRVSAAGAVTTLAGSGTSGNADGSATTASFSAPKGIALDPQGNLVVADANAIRRVTTGGAVSTIAGAAGSAGSADGASAGARFDNPRGVAVDAAGTIYVADTGNNTIRKISAAGQVTTVAGSIAQSGSADGLGRAALFNAPMGVAPDAQGNLYVADTSNGTVRKITPAGAVTTLAGTPVVPRTSGSIDGLGQEARFFSPRGIAVDAAGTLLLADSANHTVRKIGAAGEVTTLAGNKDIQGELDGRGAEARFLTPGDVAVDGGGNLYLLDAAGSSSGIGSLRKVAPDGSTTTVTVPLDPDNVRPLSKIPVVPSHLAIAADTQGNYYIASTVYYRSSACLFPDKNPSGPTPRECDDLDRTAIRRIAPSGEAATIFSTDRLPAGVSAGSMAVVGGMVADAAGNVYISDPARHMIFKRAASGEVTPFAGGANVSGTADGSGTDARFSTPTDLALDNAGNVYVLDSANFTVRKITPQGVVTTLAGTAGKDELVLGSLPGSLSRIGGISVDAKGVLYVSLAHGVVKIVTQ